MKLYKAPPTTVVRIEIIERGQKSKTITVDERDSALVANNVKEMLDTEFTLSINPTIPSRKISIQCYDCVGNKKGKFSTLTIYSISVDEVYNFIMKNLGFD
jgi:hypothetical protein